MKKLLHLLLLAPLLAFAQPTPPGGAPPASQAEVNAGLISNKYVSPKTLSGWTGGGGGGAPGGVNGDFQYNDNGSFGGYTLAQMTNLIFGQTITTINATTVNVSVIQPATNDGAALGSISNQFSDLFLAEGGVINWDNGDAMITQAGNVVTLAGAGLTLSETTSLLLGTAGSAVGNIGFRNATSGTITLAPTTGALGSVTLTLPAVTGTLLTNNSVEKLAVFSVDGGGVAITTGTVAGTVRLPFACTLTGWSISATGATGTNTIRIWNVATGTAIPTIANVINTSGVSLTTGTAVASSTLSDFTDTSYAALDMMRCAVTAVDGTATDLTVTLYGTRQ